MPFATHARIALVSVAVFFGCDDPRCEDYPVDECVGECLVAIGELCTATGECSGVEELACVTRPEAATASTTCVRAPDGRYFIVEDERVQGLEFLGYEVVSAPGCEIPAE